MAKPNYSYAKRQRELAKIKKREAKRLKKLEKAATEQAGLSDDVITDAPGNIDTAGNTTESQE